MPDLRITLDTTPDIEYEENNLRRYKQRKAFQKCQNRQFSLGKLAVLVRAAGLEPTVSWSQTRRDTKLR